MLNWDDLHDKYLETKRELDRAREKNAGLSVLYVSGLTSWFCMYMLYLSKGVGLTAEDVLTLTSIALLASTISLVLFIVGLVIGRFL